MLRSVRSAGAVSELWRRGEETGRRLSRSDEEESSYRGGTFKKKKVNNLIIRSVL